MKTIILLIGVLFLAIAGLSTPVAIGLGLYDWVISDAEFKFALWFGFKVWIFMLASGVIVGVPCFLGGQSA